MFVVRAVRLHGSAQNVVLGTKPDAEGRKDCVKVHYGSVFMKFNQK